MRVVRFYCFFFPLVSHFSWMAMLPIGPVQIEPWIPILEGPLGRSPYGPRVFQAAFTLPGRRRFPISVFTIGFPVFVYVPSRTSIARNWSRSAVFHSVASFGRNHNGKECRWRYWPVINYGYRLIRSQSSFRSLSLMAQKNTHTYTRRWESESPKLDLSRFDIERAYKSHLQELR